MPARLDWNSAMELTGVIRLCPSILRAQSKCLSESNAQNAIGRFLPGEF